jgi:3-dehydroquinate dehydratase-2
MTAAPNGLILLLSGPNLDLFGTRQPEVYGHDTLDDYVAIARTTAAQHGYGLEHFQSAAEAEVVAAVHGARGRCDAIVINPAAFTHYAWAIHDALAAFDGVIVELHVSNPNAREPWRHTSVVSPVATASVMGFKGVGYRLAVEGAVALLA